MLSRAFRRSLFISSTLGFVSLGIAHAQPRVNAYLARPRVSGVPSLGANVTTTVEQFNQTAQRYKGGTGTGAFSSAIGTYNFNSASTTTVAATDANFVVQADDQFGAGTGQYMTFGAQSSTHGAITLQFSSARNFFGFSWNAGDANNGITFFSGTTRIGRFSTANIIEMLRSPTIKALDGTTYNSADYNGKPLPGGGTPTQTTNEPFGYLAFYAAPGVTFDRVVLDNSGSVSTGFETDNHTIIASGIPELQGSFVSVGAAVQPEPGTFALLLPVAGGALFWRRKRTRRRERE